MSFHVYPCFYRRAGRILSKAAAIVSLLEMALLLAALYLKEYMTELLFAAFLFSVILSIVAWRAYELTSRYNHRVEIQIKSELITLFGQKGEVLRSFFFSDIAQVKTVNLPMVVYRSYVPIVRKEPFICITSTAKDIKHESDADYESLSRNPYCIVFAYDQSALDLLQSLLPDAKFETGK